MEREHGEEVLRGRTGRSRFVAVGFYEGCVCVGRGEKVDELYLGGVGVRCVFV